MQVVHMIKESVYFISAYTYDHDLQFAAESD